MPLLPRAIQRSFVRQSKEWLVRSNRHPLSRVAGLQAYRAMQSVITRQFRQVEGVRALYLCHSLAAGECYPGLSDFDLTVVFDSDDPLSFYDRIRRVWGSLKRYFPISDLSLVTTDEFAAWQTLGGGWDPLDEVRHWKRLAGDECRHPTLDLQQSAAVLDRMQWALGHFQNLLTLAIKEEPRSPLMAVIARRQLYKCFWSAVLPLDPTSFEIAAHRARVSRWLQRNGRPDAIAEIEAMYECRFLGGPVSTARFAAAALAYQLLDDSLAVNPLVSRPLVRPGDGEDTLSIANLPDVVERASAMCASLLEMIENRIASIILGSTGTARGYAFYVVLNDDLTQGEIAGALRDIRAVYRVFDDPWMNEHFPAGVPIVCSRRMFRARLQTGRSSLHYFEKFRRVLYGADLYLENVMAPPSHNADDSDARSARLADWAREHLAYSFNLHQIYLGGIKPALHDYVTFYLPRLMLQHWTDRAPATAEEAACGYARLARGLEAELPHRMLDDYRGKDLDALLRTMAPGTFRDVWPLLSQGLHSVLTAS